MWAEYGHLALCFSFAASILAFFASFIKDELSASTLTIGAFRTQFVSLVISFLCLIAAFIVSDFSVDIVVSNSHSAKPILYKIAGAWGNHEGSMLLWMLLLGGYCAAYAQFERVDDTSSLIEYRVLSLISVATLIFILAASNPFLRVETIPADGRGLNPLLQDPGLAIHPPILYMGYVGFAVPYAMAIGTILQGGNARQWAKKALPWIALPLAFLTLGVGLGSWWAYRELGWGGFWFWDPVENASLLPWLIGAALLHGAVVLKRTGSLAQSTLLLAIITFSLSILGTFLVRSGVLTSVHSFAVDPRRGLLIFIFLIFILGGGLAVFGLKKNTDAPLISWSLTSRPGFMSAGILLFIIIAATVLVGTLYPLFTDAMGGSAVTVGAPYFNATARPLGWLLVAVMVIAPFAKWGGALPAKLAIFKSKGGVLILLAALATIPLTQVKFTAGLWDSFIFAFSFLLCGFIILYAVKRMIFTTLSIAMLLSHGGIALAALGMTGTAFFSSETIVSVTQGDRFNAAGRVLSFNGVERGEGANFFYDRATVTLLSPQDHIQTTLSPERRWYPAGNMTTSEAVIDRTLISDFYVTLGDLRTPGAGKADWALRVYHRPFISWVWAGCILIFLGVGLSSWQHFRRRRPKKLVNSKFVQSTVTANSLS